MDQLWAPWRLAYIANPKPAGADDECFICKGLGEADDRTNQIVERGPRSVILLNRFPYNNGHLLVAPIAHKGHLRDLDDSEALEMQQTLARLMNVLAEAMRPDGWNVGLNIGRFAGAGLPGHLHWHLVPRWNGDTNFMPVLTDTRVISQSLESLYDLLVKGLRGGSG
jgi:ATP adenylyltransferase